MNESFLSARDAFEKLSDDIYAGWDASDPNHLSASAAAALRINADRLLALAPTEMLQWALRGELPAQSWSNDFGDPALTVVDRPDFRIDVLYWDHNASPTHKHVSCGAFLAHHGDRLHQRFEFDGHDQYDEYVRTGSLVGAPREAMPQGGVYEIRPELIHDLFWLKRPSVTVSIRCKGHPGAHQKPNEFWGPGLEVLDMVHHETSLVRRQVGAVRLLHSASPRLFAEEVTAAIADGSPALAYQSMILLAELGYRAGQPHLDPLVLAGMRSDGLGERLGSSFGHFVRKLELGGIYTADRAAQVMVALMWAGAEAEEARSVMSAYVPEISVERAAELAIRLVEGVDPVVSDILRARAGEFRLDRVV